MGLKIVCSGHLVRYPLGGHSWHHLQYLVGFKQLGHEVTFFEDYGWPESCYDPQHNEMTADPSYGIDYLRAMLRPHGLDDAWCYLAEDGTAHGMPREQLAELCRDSDVHVNLSNVNWIPELKTCRRRVLVDTDPVFTQIGAHGVAESFSCFDVCFTYGENVHKPGCEMPTADTRWLPTRQPVVLDLWPVERGDPTGRFTTVINWTPSGEREHEGRVYGQKDREFVPYFTLPRRTGARMEVAVGGSKPDDLTQRLVAGGWTVADPVQLTRDPWTYQEYLRGSMAEFCVAKHGYVSTRCGWFSDRTSGYLASGRPAVVQDTGFSEVLPIGTGLIAFRTPDEAIEGVRRVREDYERHSAAARAIAEEYFSATRVLTALLERAL
jgi:hypothetical protein